MTKHLLQVEAIFPVRQDQTERGAVFHQDLSISAARDLEGIFGIKDDTELNVFFWVEVLDPEAAVLSYYCFTPSSRLSLLPGETQVVTLSFDVPAQVEPGSYPYTIVFKTEQVLEETLRVSLKLEILPIQSAIRFKPIPGFQIDPVTTATDPSQLQSGQSIAFKILVENRSSTSDQFYLSCPTLPKDWYTLKYLDYGKKVRGVVQPANGLRLNPHEQGEILLSFHPPRETVAGDYCVPLQLISMNHPDLGLVDEVYLQLLPDTRIYTELSPETQIMTNKAKPFTLKLINRGNLSRQFKLEIRDAHRLFTFSTDQPDNIVEIAPGAEATLLIQANPQRWWQRPLGSKSKKLPVSFNLIPVGADPGLASPIAPQARLIWQPYPLWLRAIVLLGGTSAIAAAFLFLLYRFNHQPSPALEILSFNAAGVQPENDGTATQLNWRLIDPGSLDRIEIARIETGAETASQTYNFKAGIPANLQAQSSVGSGCRSTTPPPTSAFTLWQLPLPPIPGFASLQQPAAPMTTIDCQAISIALPKPGEYRFRLKLFSKDNPHLPTTDRTTGVITVKGNEALAQSDQSRVPRSPVQPQFSPPVRSTQIVSFTVNGRSVLSEPTQTYSVGRNSDGIYVTLAWEVRGDNATVQLLPSLGTVPTRGITRYWLRRGSASTLTLVAGNRLGDQVTQSVVLQAVSPPRSLQPKQSPTPSPTGTPPDAVQGDPNHPNNTPNGESPVDASPTPDPSSTPNESPIPSSPDALPTP